MSINGSMHYYILTARTLRDVHDSHGKAGNHILQQVLPDAVAAHDPDERKQLVHHTAPARAVAL